MAAAALLLPALLAAPASAAALCSTLGTCVTVISSGPTATPTGGSTTSTAAQFAFAPKSQSGHVSFTCTLEKDGDVVRPPADCTDAAGLLSSTSSGTATYTGLAPGEYLFSVQATVGLETGDATTWAWQVSAPDAGGGPTDIQPPQTSITAGAPRWRAYPFLTVRYAADEAVQGYECTLDGAARSCPADGRLDLFHLSSGDHVLKVAAIDQAGNVDPTPAKVRWTQAADDASFHWSKGARAWKKKDGGADALDQSYHRTSAKGAWAYRGGSAFRSVALLVRKAPGAGTVEAYAGKKLLRRVPLDASKVRFTFVPLGSWGKKQTARITVRVVSTGEPVGIDGIAFSQRAS